MSKTTKKFLPEARERTVRMALDHEGHHVCRWAAVVSTAGQPSPCPAHREYGRQAFVG
jgi:transposase